MCLARVKVHGEGSVLTGPVLNVLGTERGLARKNL